MTSDQPRAHFERCYIDRWLQFQSGHPSAFPRRLHLLAAQQGSIVNNFSAPRPHPMTLNLPAPRSFTASLFAQLSALSAPPSRTPSSNPLNDAPAALKNVFLTLHCLFPNELLAALDLLDRRLVTRLVVSCPRVDEACGPPVSRDNAVYYVRSSQPTRASRYAAAGGSSYEVRLKAWNCSCPAFTFSAVNAMEENGVHGGGVDVDRREEGSIDAESGSDYGGLMLEAGAVPLCKHLLACFLAEKCGMFSGFVEERVVGEEAAGWAAGWGD